MLCYAFGNFFREMFILRFLQTIVPLYIFLYNLVKTIYDLKNLLKSFCAI